MILNFMQCLETNQSFRMKLGALMLKSFMVIKKLTLADSNKNLNPNCKHFEEGMSNWKAKKKLSNLLKYPETREKAKKKNSGRKRDSTKGNKDGSADSAVGRL